MAIYAKAGEWRFGDDALKLKELYRPDLYALDDETLASVRTNLTGMTQTRFAEIVLQPHHAGFGMWQRSGDAEYAWDDADNLLNEIETNLDSQVYELGVDDLSGGIEDIRGSIYEEPTRVFAYQDDQGEVRYFGIDSAERHIPDERGVEVLEDDCWVPVGLGDLEPIKETHKTPLPGLVRITNEILRPKHMDQVLDDYEQTIEAGGCEIQLFSLTSPDTSFDDVAASVIRDRSATPLPRYYIVLRAPNDLRSLRFEAHLHAALKRAEDSCQSPEAWSPLGREGVEVLFVSNEEADAFYQELAEYLRKDSLEIERRRLLLKACVALGIG